MPEPAYKAYIPSPDILKVVQGVDIAAQAENLKKLKQIALLKDGWNGYGAVSIPNDTLCKAQRLIRTLNVQPEIFPTADGNIQMEYEKDNGDYLEFQFTGEGICEVFRLMRGNEEYFSLPDNASSINELVDAFYGF